jgi:hypothetical protein
MNFANRKATLFALPHSIGQETIVTVSFGTDQTVFSIYIGGIDHTRRVLSEGSASKVGHPDPTLKLSLILLNPPFQDELFS